MIPTCACGLPASYVYQGKPVCYEHSVGCEDAEPLPPYVGMPATVCYASDRFAVTVTYVSKTGHRVIVHEDTATRVDTNGMSENQTYTYTSNPAGSEHVFFRNSAGFYGSRRNGKRLALGFKESHHDYSY